MGKLVEILKLTRIEHSLLLLVAVVSAELIAGWHIGPLKLALSLITPVFISMAAFAINDYFDIKVDKLNHRTRPLVTGTIKPGEAINITIASLIIGVGASAFINPGSFAIAAIFGLLALLYSYKLKEKLFWGNAYIAFSMAIPFIYGSYVAGNAVRLNILLVAIMIFLSGLAREIHGTIRDYSGDVLIRNAHTIPKKVGIKASAYLAAILYASAILLSIYLFAAVPPFRLNVAYGLFVFFTDAMLVYVSLIYFSRHASRYYDLARNLSLFAMGLALVAILLSPLI